MGFWSSLKNQLGRDTGRRISNRLFGMKHYHPHKFEGTITRESKSKGGNVPASKTPTATKGITTTENITITEDKTEIERIKAEKFQAKLEIAKDFFDLNDAKTKADKQAIIDQIINIDLAETKDELVDQLSNLLATVSSTPQGELFAGSGKRNYEQDIRNACIEKLDIGILKLTSLKATEERYFFQKKLDILERRRRQRGGLKTIIIIGIILLFVALTVFVVLNETNK